jgi:hypothetical protein
MKPMLFGNNEYSDVKGLIQDWYNKQVKVFPERELWELFSKAGIDDELPRNVYDEIGRHEIKMKRGRIKYKFYPEKNKHRLLSEVVFCRRMWTSARANYHNERLERNKVTDSLNRWFLFALALLCPYILYGLYLIGYFMGTLLGA